MEREYTLLQAAGAMLVWLVIISAIGYVGLQALWALAGGGVL